MYLSLSEEIIKGKVKKRFDYMRFTDFIGQKMIQKGKQIKKNHQRNKKD